MRNTSLHQRLRDIQVVILDFDGTMTDGFVSVDQNGCESVRCSRKDGLGIEMLRKAGLRLLVLSKETNPVVEMRCRKLCIECVAKIDNKAEYLRSQYPDTLEKILYMGDDINDLECIKLAGIGVTVADGHPECKLVADYITERRGGDHAVREMCDWILKSKKE